MPNSLSILIASLESRREALAKLREELERQARTWLPAVEILAEVDDGKTPTGAKRQALVNKATGDYFAFVDDDDGVSPDYVQSIMEGLSDSPDVVTFRMACAWPGRNFEWELHPWSADRTPTFAGRQGMAANHLCAWRRGLAQAVGRQPIYYNEDVFWYTPLLKSGIVKSEYHIPAPLYRYTYSPVTSAAQTITHMRNTQIWARGGVDAWWLDGQIAVAVHGRSHNGRSERVEVRMPDGSTRRANLSEMELICTVTAR